jgi:flagellar basal-body rod protein FlgF
LVSGAGNIMLGDGGPLVIPPHQSLEIAGDGTVTIIPQGQTGTTMIPIGRLKLVTDEAGILEKKMDGLFGSGDGKTLEADARIQVRTGVLESSNVNAVSALVDLIQLARQYEMNIKMMNLAQENDQASARIMQLS